MAFAKRHNLFVIEDNAEAFGGAYKGKKTGTLGDIAGCSFCQNKTFTTGGEGGMVTTDDEDLAWLARSFRDHGYDVKERLNLLELEQKLPYIHNMVGWNYRMTEMQSAIGLAELDADGHLEHAAPPPQRAHHHGRAQADEPQVKFLPIDTPERQNGWFVLAFSLDIENMRCDIERVRQGRRRRGRARAGRCSGRSATPRRAFQEHNAFGRSGFPFTSKEYADPASVDYTQGRGAQRPAGTRRTPSPASPTRPTSRTTASKSARRSRKSSARMRSET